VLNLKLTEFRSDDVLKYFKIFLLMVVGQLLINVVFLQNNLSEKIIDIVGTSLFATFFWWLFDWSKHKKQ
jgi:hypothetical protein